MQLSDRNHRHRRHSGHAIRVGPQLEIFSESLPILCKHGYSNRVSSVICRFPRTCTMVRMERTGHMRTVRARSRLRSHLCQAVSATTRHTTWNQNARSEMGKLPDVVRRSLRSSQGSCSYNSRSSWWNRTIHFTSCIPKRGCHTDHCREHGDSHEREPAVHRRVHRTAGPSLYRHACAGLSNSCFDPGERRWCEREWTARARIFGAIWRCDTSCWGARNCSGGQPSSHARSSEL